MKTLFISILLGLLSACSGIPLASLPRLASLQNELLNANPAGFMIGVQMDHRMVPPAGAVPVLLLVIRPAEPGAFEIVDKKLPMRMTTSAVNTPEISPTTANRRWLVYSLTPESQAELLRIQHYFRQIQARQNGHGGGNISIGIAQDGIAAKNPELRNTEWTSWLQISRREGFFKLWSGSVADLLKQAKSERE
jgi:hypothetical protein